MNGVNATKRLRILVSGRVQGVGFRPFLWRLANELRLSGFCRNTVNGVEIEVQGNGSERFLAALRQKPPALAAITEISTEIIPIKAGEASFEILASLKETGTSLLVSPDLAICADCLADIRAPGNPRYGYAFANCTNCGPRFSITRDLPYDRPATSMACFAMCAACAREYTDPVDRRFHAQPVACANCGPNAWFVTKADIASGNTARSAANSAKAVAKAASAILSGGIVAIRGIGGFQLACDARNGHAVELLRKRKKRPHKALALMVADLEAAESICNLTDAHRDLLSAERKPIVLCPARECYDLKERISPDSPYLGLMLPYTPLHALLFDSLRQHSGQEPLLVLTSANPATEPICLGNREAMDRLFAFADAWLLHDRDILCRTDDSVVAAAASGPVFYRRSRGYVPEPVKLLEKGCNAFGAGAQLKATFCLTRADYAFLGQHIGDLDSLACMDFYEEALSHLQSLLKVRPEVVGCDLHPNLESSRFAEKFATRESLELVRVQHHLAHAVSCLAENRIHADALAICLDGSGLGTDQTIWGGEILQVNIADAVWSRLGCLSPFDLPGGEAAVREPWRLAAAFRFRLGSDLDAREKPLAELISKGINTQLTSSAGRLFDAMAAALGLCSVISYEGQAAIRLEQAASQWLRRNAQSDCPNPQFSDRSGLLQLDSASIFRHCIELQEAGESQGRIAAVFHCMLAAGFTEIAWQCSARTGLTKVALSGGVMQNVLFAQMLVGGLQSRGLEPVLHRQVPPGDGGLSLGQAVWAQRLHACR